MYKKGAKVPPDKVHNLLRFNVESLVFSLFWNRIFEQIEKCLGNFFCRILMVSIDPIDYEF